MYCTCLGLGQCLVNILVNPGIPINDCSHYNTMQLAGVLLSKLRSWLKHIVFPRVGMELDERKYCCCPLPTHIQKVPEKPNCHIRTLANTRKH